MCPQPSQERSNLAQEIEAINLPGTIEEALHRKKATDGPIFVNINLNGQTVTKSSASAYSTQMGDVIDWAKRLKSRASESCQSTLEWIKSHKKRFTFYCLASTYGSIQLCIWYLGYRLGRDACWSLWKNHCTLEDLYRYKQTDLIQEVLEEVRRRSHAADADDSTLLTVFAKEVDREIAQLKLYQALSATLDRLYLKKIFFSLTTLATEAQNRINRLLFIKNSVLGASAMYNSLLRPRYCKMTYDHPSTLYTLKTIKTGTSHDTCYEGIV